METEIPVLDPVLADFEMPLHGVYHPLGFTVEIATNCPEVLAGAQESWGHFHKIFHEPAVTIRVGVTEGGSEICPAAPVCRAQRHLLTRVADERNYAVSDMSQGFAFSWLTQAVVKNRAYLRYHFLEGMAWDLLDSLYLTSIHAACVSKQGQGILLCGDSGAGKSSLSFACARSGWAFLSDDSTCLVRTRAGRVVVGNPYQIRFRQSAMDLFPELRDQRLTLRATGELALEIPTANLKTIKTASQCNVDHIVFLNRGTADPPNLLPYPKDKALKKFEQVVCFGERETRDAQRASLRNLLEADVFEMRYTDMDSALSLLDSLVCNGARSPSAVGVDSEEGDRA